jgi:hypothetical protein
VHETFAAKEIYGHYDLGAMNNQRQKHSRKKNTEKVI